MKKVFGVCMKLIFTFLSALIVMISTPAVRAELDEGSLEFDLNGHVNNIADICWSPDGTKIATCEYDEGRTIVWDKSTGKKLFMVEIENLSCIEIEWSPDGKLIAVAGYNNSLVIIDAITGKIKYSYYDMRSIGRIKWSPDSKYLLFRRFLVNQYVGVILDAHTGGVNKYLLGFKHILEDLDWSPDGKRIASVSYDTLLTIWNVMTGNPEFTLKDQYGANKLAWSPDGKKIVTIGHEYVYHLWDVVKGELIKKIPTLPCFFLDFSWSPDSKKFIINESYNRVYICDGSTGEKIKTLYGVDFFEKVRWSPDGSKIAGQIYGYGTNIWDAETGDSLFNRTSFNFEWSPDGKNIVVATFGTNTLVYNSESWKTISVTGSHKYSINKLMWDKKGTKIISSDNNFPFVWNTTYAYIEKFLYDNYYFPRFFIDFDLSPDNSKVAVMGEYYNKTTIYDLNTYKIIINKDIFNSSNVRQKIRWSPDGKFIACMNGLSSVFIYDSYSLNVKTQLSENKGVLYDYNWSPDGSRIASVGDDSLCIIWDAISGNVLHKLRGHKGIVTKVEWSPDGKRLVTGSDDFTSIVWDVASGDKLSTLRGHTGEILSLQWSPDGTKIASSSNDWRVILWDAIAGSRLHTFNDHKAEVNEVQWSPDGSRIASAGNDGLVVVSDVASGKNLHTILANNSRVYFARWSPDGSRLASAGSGASVKIWYLGRTTDVGEFVPQLADGFNIFPNPSESTIEIEIQSLENENRKLQIFDIGGIEMLNRSVPSGARSLLIDISYLPSGVYYIKIDGQSKMLVKE